MATSKGSPSPKYSPTQVPTLSPVVLWIVTVVGLAVAWQRFPDHRKGILLLVIVFVFVLYLRSGGTFISQIETLGSGHTVTPAQTGFNTGGATPG